MSEGDASSEQEVVPQLPRNLIICCDGTANEPKAGGSSNVFRLVRLLRRQERQLVYYDPGLGTESSPSAQTAIAKVATKILGLAFGYGLSKNIADAYSYLMEHYQQGDRIYLFGFSRGAYTVRAIAGMLHTIGLLEQGSHNLIYYAIRLYRKQGTPKWADMGAFKGTLCRRIEDTGRYSVPIHFLGVWDTVKSVGLSSSSIRLQHTDTLPNVAGGRHAVSLGEKRRNYRHDLWTATGQARGDFQAVWFPGVHSDVGGSYGPTERGLADAALEWMLDGAESHGLRVDRVQFEKGCARRRGLARLERAQELADKSQDEAWKKLAGELGDTLTGAKSWTRKLQKRFSEPDVADLAVALEADVTDRYERPHNPLFPIWWILGWWRRKLPERAWIHRGVVERIRRKTKDLQQIKPPLSLLLRFAGDEAAADVHLVDSVLVARRRGEDGVTGEVLLQTLGAGEVEAISAALGEDASLSAAEALDILRAKGIELWQQELDGLSLDEAKKEDLSGMFAEIAAKIKAYEIKGDGGALDTVLAFRRKRSLTTEQKEQIEASAPYLIESLAEWPWQP